MLSKTLYLQFYLSKQLLPEIYNLLQNLNCAPNSDHFTWNTQLEPTTPNIE